MFRHQRRWRDFLKSLCRIGPMLPLDCRCIYKTCNLCNIGKRGNIKLLNEQEIKIPCSLLNAFNLKGKILQETSISIQKFQHTLYGKAVWQSRVRLGDYIVSRMYSVNLKHIRWFHFCHAPGAKSFEELRTFENTVHESFKGTCRTRNLSEDYDEW